MPANERKILSQQILLGDASVYSAQWTTLPTSCCNSITTQYLLDRYLEHIRRFTFTLVRPLCCDGGIRFSLLGTSVSLLSFSLPRPVLDPDSLTLSISGGLLVCRKVCTEGKLRFVVRSRPRGTRIMLRLSGYSPLILGPAPSRLRKLLYRVTQAFIHQAVTVLFLDQLGNDLTGERRPVRLLRPRPACGERI